MARLYSLDEIEEALDSLDTMTEHEKVVLWNTQLHGRVHEFYEQGLLIRERYRGLMLRGLKEIVGIDMTDTAKPIQTEE